MGLPKGRPLSKKNVEALRRAWANPEVHAKRVRILRAAHQRLEARVRHSKASKKSWNEPGARIRRTISRRKRGTYFKGGMGRRPWGFVLKLWRILKPLGYVREHAIGVPGYSIKNYKVDFALVQNKIAIECDGPCHIPFAQKIKDRKKDRILHSFGWKVIRVPHGERT